MPTHTQRHNVRVTGGGPRTLVLGHGFGTDQTAWRHLVPWLSTRYRVVGYDLACSGAVDPELFDLRRYRTLDGYADDLLGVLDELRIERCVYLAHSVSGMVGLLAAWRQPTRFERMVMIAPSPRYLNDEGYHGGFEPPDLEQLFAAISDNHRLWAASFAPHVARREPDDPAVREFSAGLLAMRPDVALWAAMVIFRSDLRDRLEGFPVPAVVIQTRDDPAVPAAVGDHLRARLPACTLETIEAAGHLPHLTAPDQVLAVLKRHL